MTDLSPQKAHRDYVSGVLFYYQQYDIQPGDPNEGDWEEAHYPKPKRLGGDKTILLLKKHHAVQGVLQSEEYQCCCVSGDYMAFVRGTEYEERMSWWLGEHLRKLNREKLWTPEQRAAHSKAQLKRFKEQPVSDKTRAKQSAARKGVSKPPFTEEHRANIRAGLATPESKAKRSKIAHEVRRFPYIVYDIWLMKTTVYPTGKDAASKIGCAPDSVHRAARSGKPSFNRRYLVKRL